MRRFMVVLAVLVSRVAMSSGTLEIVSEPRGATILVNGVAAARAPCAVRLAAGFYTVSATGKGYETEHQAVDVLEGRTVGLEFRLRPASVEFEVKCDVNGAFVCIDGILVGMVNERIMVPAGVHSLAVVADGYRDSITKVSLSSQGKTVNVKLLPGISFMSGMLDLSGAQWVNSRGSGWRPFGGSVIFSNGDGAVMEYKTSTRRSSVLALSIRFRFKNVSYFRVDGPGVYRSGMRGLCVGQWHTLLFEVSDRSARSTIDGNDERQHAAVVEVPLSVRLSAMAPGNNEAFYIEVGSVVLREFDSAQQMAAVLGRSVVK